MADVANTVSVSKDLCDVEDSSVASECCETNKTKPEAPILGFQEIDSFSDLSFKTGDDISLSDLMESEFDARISSLSAEPSPQDEEKDGFDHLDKFQNLLHFDPKPGNEEFNLLHVDDHSRGLNLDEFLAGPIKSEDLVAAVEGEIGPSPDVVCDNGTPTAEPDLVAFKTARPTEMALVASFDPFARIEEDSDCSNSNPITAPNVLNSPDEFPFPESPQEGQTQCDEPMVDLFVKTISDENLDLSESAQNDFSRFQTSSVESVNNSFPNVSDLTSPDRADHDEFFSDDLISSEQVETIIDHDDGTLSVSHPVDLSTEETEAGLEDQSLHHVEQTGDDDDDPLENDESAEGDLQIVVTGTVSPIGEDDVSETPPLSEGLVTTEKRLQQDTSPEFARTMAPLAEDENTDEWTTVEAALEGAVETEMITAESVDCVQGVDSSVTNPATVTNAPDIQIVLAEDTDGTDEDSSEVSVAFFFSV